MSTQVNAQKFPSNLWALQYSLFSNRSAMCLKIDWIYRAVAKKASITHAVRYTPCQDVVF